MTPEPEHFEHFLSLLQERTGKQVSHSDAIFHRSFAKHRHRPHPEDENRTWLSILLRKGMTDHIRHQLYPSIFDLGNIPTDSRQTGTLKELIADINGPRRKTLKRDKLGEKTSATWEPS